MRTPSSFLHRRRFLQSLGILTTAAIGGNAFPDIFAYPDHRTVKKTIAPQRVIVIGAGLSGLVAAMELKAAGHEVIVLEGRMRPGGRVYTIRNKFADNLHAEAGAVIYASSYNVANKYIDQFGLKRLDYDVPALKSHFHLKGRHMIMDGSPVTWPYDLTAEENQLGPFGVLQKYLIDTLPADIGKFDDWRSLQSLKQLDTQSLGDYMRSHGASEGALELVRRTMYFGNAVDHGSALSSLISDLHFFFTGARFFLLEGGNDSLPRAMADTLRSEINYGVRVAAIEQINDKVRVQAYRGDKMESVEGDRVICTIPATVLRGISFTPALDAAKQRAMQSLKYLDTTRTFIQVKRAFWADLGLSGTAYTDLPIQDVGRQPYSMKIDSTKRAILESHVRGPEAQHIAAMSEAEAVAFTIQEMSKIFPDLPSYQEGGIVKAWSKDPFALSAYSWPGPGDVTTYLQDLQKPHGRVHFAGEHTSVVRALMEGALRSGVRAAQEIGEA